MREYHGWMEGRLFGSKEHSVAGQLQIIEKHVALKNTINIFTKNIKGSKNLNCSHVMPR